MPHAVVHFEVGAADDGPLVAFYAELFGWGTQSFPGGGYTMIDTQSGAGINGGIGRSQTGDPWATFYVETDDLQATLDKANALGGTTVMPVTDFGGAVTIAMFADPDGLLIGLVKTAEPGHEDAPAPSAGSGGAVTWFEVMGADAAKSQKFYADLFGWTVDDSHKTGYATADPAAGRGIYGGVGGGVAGRWATVYARVPDVDEALSRAQQMGASLITDSGVPELKAASRETLYGGPLDDGMKTAVLRDPAGNVFGLYHRHDR